MIIRLPLLAEARMVIAKVAEVNRYPPQPLMTNTRRLIAPHRQLERKKLLLRVRSDLPMNQRTQG